jgi:glycerol-3-phosphate dehydrogenase subunit B
MLIAGFHELRDFFPPLITSNLHTQGIAARGVYLEVPRRAKRLDYTPRTFANLFDDPAFRQEIGRQLHTMRGTAHRIGLPAVLGLRDPLNVVQELQRLSGAQIFEIPTLPPSVPGMRLFRIFRDAIAAAGGRLQIGSEVLHSEGSNGTLEAVYTEAAAREQEHRARGFLLATGGIAGGGIRADYQGKVRETALNLPLQAPAERGKWFASRFLHKDGHPIFQSGIPTDERLRPVDQQQKVVYQNVVVAGTTLSGSDPIEDRSLTGLALTTGWHAGHLLAEMLQDGE